MIQDFVVPIIGAGLRFKAEFSGIGIGAMGYAFEAAIELAPLGTPGHRPFMCIL